MVMSEMSRSPAFLFTFLCTNSLTFGFPAIVAFSMDREAYAVMRGSFTEKAVTSFLHGVTSGRQPTIKVSQMPVIVTTEPWDGQDGAPIEEELSLADIMGWDDEEEGEL
jgi:protein disulfide-isomerase A6